MAKFCSFVGALIVGGFAGFLVGVGLGAPAPAIVAGIGAIGGGLLSAYSLGKA